MTVSDTFEWTRSARDSETEAKNPTNEISKDIDQLLLFSVGKSVYATEIISIQRIVKFQELVRLPNEPAFIPGIIHLHFGITKVIDIRKIIPLDTPLGPHAKIIIFSSQTDDSVHYGMIVDDVLGVVELMHEHVTSMIPTTKYFNNNFMIGWFMLGIKEFQEQNNRKATDGNDKIVWIDFEGMIDTIINEKNTEEIVFRLTALFNPDYLLSEEYQHILRSKAEKKYF